LFYCIGGCKMDNMGNTTKVTVDSGDGNTKITEQTKRKGRTVKKISTNEKITDTKILEIIMNHSQDTIYFKDRDSKFIANSKAHAVQFGLEDPRDLAGKSDYDFFPEPFARSAEADEKRIMETGVPIIGKNEKWVTPEGKVTWLSASKYPIFDDDGTIVGTWGTSRDITTLKETQEELALLNQKLEETNIKLQKLSDLDGLSELFNQRRFHEILEDTMNIYRRKKELGTEGTFCVILMDIDRFKQINDQYGHPMGDRAIRFLADLIRRNKRENDICFRCGGDEFAIILLDTDLEAGIHVAERLREIIDESFFEWDNKRIHITISLGVEKYQDEDNIYKLLTKVDKKLYISKKLGKNQVN